ncbi:PAS domain S-box protein [Neobacillus sp. SAB-20_R2A]|uniref:PAS domain S-box protein n=1 Tax=Neobacillus sp. SAB-20_R2A TaxID=3120519 RepID=UPI003C6E837E
MNSPVENIKNEKNQLLKKYIGERFADYEMLFERSQNALLLLDTAGNIVRVNPTFEMLCGYTAKEVITMKLQTFFPLDSLDNVFHHFHKTSLGQLENFDCQLNNKSGAIHDVNITNIPISVDNQIVGVIAVLKDITLLKQKKTEVRKIEEFHRVLTENVLDTIVCTNLLGKIIYISPSCETISGYKADELIGTTFSFIVHEEDWEKAYADRKLSYLGGESIRGKYRIRRKDGNLIWVEALSKPVFDPDTQTIVEVVSVVREITERIKAEEELWSRKKAFRELVEHSPDAVLIAQDKDIIFVNKTGIELLGAANAEEILSKELLYFIHPDYHQEVKERIQTVSNGETVDFRDYKVIRQDGSVFDAEIKGIPTFFNNHYAQHVIIRDITERKKTQELLLNSEKLTIAGQLAAGIAHEVRNPLTAIKGFLQLMERKMEDQTYFGIIESEIDRIELILSELLVLAKPQDVKFESVYLPALIEDIKTLIDTQAIMNNVSIEVVNTNGPITIKGDKNQLKQVFINFLKNAIEAMPNGGSCIIEMKAIGENKVQIFFKDTGDGIPPHILKRMGEPFFTTKENGTGLGIMISKQIIENHHGTVHFWSDKKGTIIEVTLPLQ